MRPQQRSFVIEYKSSRRQMLKQERSIWGDTNFKALVKEAEAEAPQLFEPRAIDVAGSKAAYAPRQETMAIAPEENIEPDAAASASIALRGCDVECHFEELTSVEPIVPVAAGSEGHVRKRRRRLNVVANEHARDVNESAVSQHQAELESISDAELRSLEAENEKLQIALVTRLIDENARMREMLRRFQWFKRRSHYRLDVTVP